MQIVTKKMTGSNEAIPLQQHKCQKTYHTARKPSVCKNPKIISPESLLCMHGKKKEV